MATVSGIVDGIGSLSSAFGQLIIPLIEIRFGWDYVFYFFIILVWVFFHITKLCALPGTTMKFSLTSLFDNICGEFI